MDKGLERVRTVRCIIGRASSPTVQFANFGKAVFQCLPQGAGRLIDVVLSWDNVVKYWGRLITRYAAVQTFNVTLHADAVPVGFS